MYNNNISPQSPNNLIGIELIENIEIPITLGYIRNFRLNQNLLRNIIINLDENNNNYSNTNLSSILNRSFEEDTLKYKKVLHDSSYNILEKINYKLNKNYNNICPIYQTEFKINEIITRLPCNHCFVPDAIEKWLKEQKNICPVCRKEYHYKEIAKKNKENSEENNEENNEENYENIRNLEITSLSNFLTNFQNDIDEYIIQQTILDSIHE